MDWAGDWPAGLDLAGYRSVYGRCRSGFYPRRHPGQKHRAKLIDARIGADFDDRFNTTFYIDPYSGALATRRHRYWRIFDFLFMLHIMDYSGRTDFNNVLIIIVALVAIWLGISGFILLFGSFSWRDFDLRARFHLRGDVLVTLIDPALSTPRQVKLKRGGNLYLSLAANNVTLPSNCGGGGSCGLCRVQMESPGLPAPNAAEKSRIPPILLDQGYRLACQHELAHSITLRIKEGTITSTVH
jgi:ferredoxin